MSSLELKTIHEVDLPHFQFGENRPDGLNQKVGPIVLPESVDASRHALLVFYARGVDKEFSFISWNAPEGSNVDDISFQDAKPQSFYVSRIVPTGKNWIPQVTRVKERMLRPGNNFLGFHSRSESGDTHGDQENFDVARIWLLYHAT